MSQDSSASLFNRKRAAFHLPDGLIYLDGNSLGPLPLKVVKRLAATVQDEWGEQLIRGWNQAGWMAQPSHTGNRIARLIGGAEGTVAVGDTLSIKVYQALAAALEMQPERRVVLSDTGNFPTDLYMAKGLLRLFGDDYQLKLVDPETVDAHIDESTAALMLTHVDYRTGRLHDMQHLSAKAHDHGIPVVWDLAHSTGALPVDVQACHADFAVGCTYKYLNAGPGAPAFIYVEPGLQDRLQPALAGWMGHADPFSFDLDYRAGGGIERMRVGTPPVLAMAALDAALDVWDDVSMHDVRAESIALSQLFIQEIEARCPMLTLASPRDPEHRGSQVSFRFEHGYAAMQALIHRYQVIGDFRAPDIMRFAFTPLYISAAQVRQAVAAIEKVMTGCEWDNVEFAARAAVT